MRKDRIKILYEDKSIIVVSKPSHLLTISTDNEKERTMFHKVIEYERKKNKNNKVFIVHRLDKYIAEEEMKSLALLTAINDELKYRTAKFSFLKENKALITYSTNKNDGKLAITKYKVVKKNKKYSLLDIEILTGRKNQIRVHMNDINHPIIGDKKYHSKTNPIQRLGLHANKLILQHPITKEMMVFEDKTPKEMLNLFE